MEKRKAAEWNKPWRITENKELTLYDVNVKILTLLNNTESAAACVMHKARLDNLMTPLRLKMSEYEFEVAVEIFSSLIRG